MGYTLNLVLDSDRGIEHQFFRMVLDSERGIEHQFFRMVLDSDRGIEHQFFRIWNFPVASFSRPMWKISYHIER